MNLLMFLFLEVLVLVGAAFLTLMERSVLGLVQLRKGPNSVGYLGLLQPLGDAVSLFSSEQCSPWASNRLFYFCGPLVSLSLSLFLWVVIPYFENLFVYMLGVMFILCCLSLGTYLVIMLGWGSNSSYSLLGGLRAAAQMISYEVSLMMVLLSYMVLVGSYNFVMLWYYQEFIWFVYMSFPVFFCMLVLILAEMNRTPFDLSEGESELVSGFNIEYMGGEFSLIMLSEYVMILFMSFLCSMLSLGSGLFSLFFYLSLVFLSFYVVLVRGSLPRYRYDKLMMLAWSSVLPVVLNFFVFYYFLFLLV